MKIIFSEKTPRILQNKKRLEKILDVTITNRGKEISIRGKAENEYTAEKVIDALNFGFSFSTSILIKKEDFIFEIINIKDHTKRKDLKRIKARIIGTKGKTLKTLNKLTNCHFELKDNYIGIIAHPEDLETGHEAVISIMKCKKKSNV